MILRDSKHDHGRGEIAALSLSALAGVNDTLPRRIPMSAPLRIWWNSTLPWTGSRFRDWPRGEHILLTEVTFRHQIDDGFQLYAAGTHVSEYRVYEDE